MGDGESVDTDDDADDDPKVKQRGKEKQTALMQTEERNTGQVEAVIYKKYLIAAGGLIWAPVLITLLGLAQAAQGMLGIIGRRLCRFTWDRCFASEQQSILRFLDVG